MPETPKPAPKPLVMLFDDDPNFASALRAGLQLHGLNVVAVTDPDDVIRHIQHERRPDAVVLDVMVDLPTTPSSRDGIYLHQRIRQMEAGRGGDASSSHGRRRMLVYFLTNLKPEQTRIGGPPQDADAFLRKPIKPSSLAKRLWADLDGLGFTPPRGHAAPRKKSEGNMLARGSLKINAREGVCKWKDADVLLTVPQFRVVEELARNVDKVRSREELEAAIGAPSGRTRPDVTSHMRRIRQRFCKVDPEFDRIECRYGSGYRWMSE